MSDRFKKSFETGKPTRSTKGETNSRDEDTVHVQVRLPRHMRSELKAKAASEDRSINDIMSKLIADYISA